MLSSAHNGLLLHISSGLYAVLQYTDQVVSKEVRFDRLILRWLDGLLQGFIATFLYCCSDVVSTYSVTFYDTLISCSDKYIYLKIKHKYRVPNRRISLSLPMGSEG